MGFHVTYTDGQETKFGGADKLAFNGGIQSYVLISLQGGQERNVAVIPVANVRYVVPFQDEQAQPPQPQGIPRPVTAPPRGAPPQPQPIGRVQGRIHGGAIPPPEDSDDDEHDEPQAPGGD